MEAKEIEYDKIDAPYWGNYDFFNAGWNRCNDYWIDTLDPIMVGNVNRDKHLDELPNVIKNVIEALQKSMIYEQNLKMLYVDKVYVTVDALTKIANATRIDPNNPTYMTWADMKVLAQEALDEINKN